MVPIILAVLLRNLLLCSGHAHFLQQMKPSMQVISIPFYIWGMLTTGPLRGVYLHQLLQLCQTLHPRAPFSPPSPRPLPPLQALRDPSFLLQQQLQHLQQHGQQHKQHSHQHSQLRQQLQAQLQQQLLAMTQPDPTVVSATAAASSAMPWLAGPVQATHGHPAAHSKLTIDPLLANAKLHQHLSEQLQATTAEQLRAAAAHAAYDSSDSHSPVSDSSGQHAGHPGQLPAGHFSPLSSHFSQESQTVLPETLAAAALSSPQQSVSSTAQWDQSQTAAGVQALAQHAQQGPVTGAVLGNSPVAPSFWAGAQGQKAMAAGQGICQLGSSQQGTSQQGTSQQPSDSSQQVQQSTAKDDSQQSLSQQGLSQQAFSQQALYQQALYQQAVSGVCLPQGHSSLQQSHPHERRFGPASRPGASDTQRDSPDAAALQSLLLQLQSAGQFCLKLGLVQAIPVPHADLAEGKWCCVFGTILFRHLFRHQHRCSCVAVTDSLHLGGCQRVADVIMTTMCNVC